MKLNALVQRSPRYIAVSLLCIAVNNALLIGLDRLGIYYGLSVLISAAIMIPLAYFLQIRVTFAAAPSFHAFWRYAAVMIVNTPAAFLLLLLIHDLGGVGMGVAAPVVTGILFIWNFTTSGWAIYSRRHRPLSAQKG